MYNSSCTHTYSPMYTYNVYTLILQTVHAYIAAIDMHIPEAQVLPSSRRGYPTKHMHAGFTAFSFLLTFVTHMSLHPPLFILHGVMAETEGEKG